MGKRWLLWEEWPVVIHGGSPAPARRNAQIILLERAIIFPMPIAACPTILRGDHGARRLVRDDAGKFRAWFNVECGCATGHGHRSGVPEGAGCRSPCRKNMRR